MLSLWLCQLQLWKILEEMGVPDPITYLLKNLYVDQEPTELDVDKLTSLKLGKEYEIAIDCQSVFVVVFNLYADYVMWNAHLQESQAGIKTARSSNGKNWRGTKKPLDEGKRGQWKSDLNFNINKTKAMAFCPTTWWQPEGEKLKTVREFIFLGFKITADDDCRRWLQTMTADLKLKDACSLEG